MACCTGIAQGPMVSLKLDPIEFAEFSKAIGLMPGITPTHSCAGAKLRKTEPALKPFVFMADEAVVEIDVVGDEDAVAHESHESVRDLGEHRRIADHLIRDAGEPRYSCRNGPLRIYQRMPFVDDLMVANS